MMVRSESGEEQVGELYELVTSIDLQGAAEDVWIW